MRLDARTVLAAPSAYDLLAQFRLYFGEDARERLADLGCRDAADSLKRMLDLLDGAVERDGESSRALETLAFGVRKCVVGVTDALRGIKSSDAVWDELQKEQAQRLKAQGLVSPPSHSVAHAAFPTPRGAPSQRAPPLEPDARSTVAGSRKRGPDHRAPPSGSNYASLSQQGKALMGFLASKYKGKPDYVGQCWCCVFLGKPMAARNAAHEKDACPFIADAIALMGKQQQ